ncbi:MAG: FecCD family ABC transporter permease [Coprobacillaceae bacterium]
MKRAKYSALFIGLALCLFLSIIASLAFGAKTIPFSEVIDGLFNSSITSFNTTIVQERIPRTVFGLVAGASLGVSGMLMQSLTRNPVADPSILGINSGAALFVVIGISFFNMQSSSHYIIVAIIGAAISAFFVYAIASMGRGGASPLKLTLAGATTTTAISSLINIIVLPRVESLTSFRFWQVGSISGATWTSIIALLPFIIIGFIIAVFVSPSLNAMAIGDETAISLGVKVTRIRIITAIAGVLLCGSVTALAGPITFVGLMVPHVMRLLFGNNIKLLVPLSAIGGAILLLVSDVVGRLLANPGEIEVGILTAFIGAPVFIFIAIKTKVKSL